MKAETNPYLDSSLVALQRACMLRASDLSSPRPRSTEERLNLAEDTRLLLISLGHAVGHGKTIPHSPEQAVDSNASVKCVDAYMEWHERQTRSHRVMTLRRAAETVLGTTANLWLAAGQGRPARTELAAHSDEALREQLGALDDVVGRHGTRE